MKTNYHTHSTFCDGKNTVEEMALAAVEKNFNVMGFSSHSMYPFGSTWHIAPRSHEDYCKEVGRVKEMLSDKIEILLGFEADFINGLCCPSFSNYEKFKPDFLIGAVHFVPGKDGFIEADGSPDTVRKGIDEFFNGSVRDAVGEYFSCQRQMLLRGNFTFMAHPDLIRKQNARQKLFDENESWYVDEIKTLAKEIAKSGVCVEINTGGMARGYLTSPYPSEHFLSLLCENKVPVTINSDAHQCQHLDYAFEEAKVLAKKAGYKELMFLTAGSLKLQNI